MSALLLTTAGVGFVLGLRHALDPDHVAAVSTILGQQRSLRHSSLVGTFWGLGHALALLVAGGALLALRLHVPPAVERWMESMVAVMLVVLGAAALRSGLRGVTLHAHRHVHDGREHVHLHAHHAEAPSSHHHVHPLGVGLKPFLVGTVHGLAGSGAVAVLALSAAPSLAAGLAYILALGLGAVAGMLVLSTLLSLPLALLPQRHAELHRRFQLLAGACTVALGLWLIGQNAVG
jgi:ABC-type nickel/cobalt efflux system permease component RcnA